MRIRAAKQTEGIRIQGIHQSAFPEGESEQVAKLANDLLVDDGGTGGLSLVAEREGELVGHIAFSPVTLEGNETFRGSILAPLGVEPEYQEHGVGGQLVESGLEQLGAQSVHVVFVYGDPKYYGRFGFSHEAAQPFEAPYRLTYPFGWQALLLNPYEAATDNRSLRIRCVDALNDPGLW